MLTLSPPHLHFVRDPDEPPLRPRSGGDGLRGHRLPEAVLVAEPGAVGAGRDGRGDQGGQAAAVGLLEKQSLFYFLLFEEIKKKTSTLHSPSPPCGLLGCSSPESKVV